MERKIWLVNMGEIKIAILGLGEAGSRFANDLVKMGVSVIGYDPQIVHTLDNKIKLASSALEAVKDVDIIFSVNLSSVSIGLAQELQTVLQPNQFYCEMNTSGPQKKMKIAEILYLSGVKMIDLAIMAPVPQEGIFTPLLAAGAYVDDFLLKIKPLGLKITGIENSKIGDAATRKLLRSIVYKGIAAVICEAIEAGKSFGMESYIRGQIVSLIGGNHELIDRFVEGSKIHAKRRKEEMEAVIEMLEERGIDPLVTKGTRDNLQKLIK
ncbi:NAD(P)-binding domain-containing protein [Parasediminibacterium paludis]|uniref:NAD(P)-binding domain-containing protein n=1 Tax=Parasediminibacterium paludis TaxID=908966 RepID=A0ABV8PUT8_9BACT